MKSLSFAIALTSGTLTLAACASGGGEGTVPSGPDAPLPPDGPPPPDAPAPPDAPPPAPDAGPPAIASITAADIVVASGHSIMLTVTLAAAAPAGGLDVALATTDPGGHLSIPASVNVPAGATHGFFDATGAAVGGPYDISATLGASTMSVPLRVAPAIAGVTPAAADLTAGTGGQYTITLEAPTPADLTVTLASAAPAVAAVPASVTVPAGQSQAMFVATGASLGGPVALTASYGGQAKAATARVLGLYLSEVLADVTGTDSTYEWVELYNASGVAIDATGMKLRVANSAAGYSDALTLQGTVAPGQCVVVGGPNVAAGTPAVTYFYAGDFSPDLGNATGGAADGLALATATGDVVDDVLYGGQNTDGLTDENGAVPASGDVGAAPTNQTIERTAPGLAGPWQVQATPSPGDCTPIGS
jgi:hypothetical protein